MATTIFTISSVEILGQEHRSNNYNIYTFATRKRILLFEWNFNIQPYFTISISPMIVPRPSVQTINWDRIIFTHFKLINTSRFNPCIHSVVFVASRMRCVSCEDRSGHRLAISHESVSEGIFNEEHLSVFSLYHLFSFLFIERTLCPTTVAPGLIRAEQLYYILDRPACTFILYAAFHRASTIINVDQLLHKTFYGH